MQRHLDISDRQSGKTTRIINRISCLLSEGKSCHLTVSSFEKERLIRSIINSKDEFKKIRSAFDDDRMFRIVSFYARPYQMSWNRFISSLNNYSRVKHEDCIEQYEPKLYYPYINSVLRYENWFIDDMTEVFGSCFFYGKMFDTFKQILFNSYSSMTINVKCIADDASLYEQHFKDLFAVQPNNELYQHIIRQNIKDFICVFDDVEYHSNDRRGNNPIQVDKDICRKCLSSDGRREFCQFFNMSTEFGISEMFGWKTNESQCVCQQKMKEDNTFYVLDKCIYHMEQQLSFWNRKPDDRKA